MTARELDGMFPDDNACKAYLASRRWPDKVRCPRCGNPKVYRLRGFTWQCQACNSKGYQFSVLVGTIFENTKIPLKDWFRTIHLMLTKRGLTIVEVQRTIDLSYRSAWYLCHRIRAALTNDGFRKHHHWGVSARRVWPSHRLLHGYATSGRNRPLAQTISCDGPRANKPSAEFGRAIPHAPK
jgi:transposase-like protein